MNCEQATASGDCTSVHPPQAPTILHRLRVPPWVTLTAGGVAFFALLRWVTLTTHNPRLIPGMVLIGALVVPVSLIAALRGKTSSSPSDVTTDKALIIALASGCLSISLAAVMEKPTITDAILPLTVVGPIEEAAKLAVIVCAVLWLVPATPRNGVVVGAACGAGFAVVETLGYVFTDYLGSGDKFTALESDLLWRSLFTPATHLAWSAILGYAVAAAASKHWAPRWTALATATYLAVAALHSAWDLYPELPIHLFFTALNLALLTVVTNCANRLQA